MKCASFSLLLSSSLFPFYRWRTWAAERWNALPKMAERILNPGKLGSRSLSTWQRCCCHGDSLEGGVVRSPGRWAPPSVFPCTPSLRLPQCTPRPADTLKTRGLNHAHAASMGPPRGYFRLHCFSERFQGTPINPIPQPGSLLWLLATIFAEAHLTHFCCHPGLLTCLATSGFPLILLHVLYTMTSSS